MAPSVYATRQQRREVLAKKLEEEVEQYVADGLALWVTAAHKAIDEFQEPVEADSSLYWFVSLAGNMLWASTVFFPEATAAVKVASILGAAVGSGTIGQAASLRELQSQSPNVKPAKEFVADEVAQRADQLEKQFVKGAKRWVRDDLMNHLIAKQQVELMDKGHDLSSPSLFEEVMDLLETPNAGRRNERRHYTYTDYLFGGISIDQSKLREDLRREMAKEMRSALISFNNQAKEYRRTLREFEARYSRPRSEYELTHPFAPRLYFTRNGAVSGQPDRRTGEIVAEWKHGKNRSIPQWVKDLPYPLPRAF